MYIAGIKYTLAVQVQSCKKHNTMGTVHTAQVADTS